MSVEKILIVDDEKDMIESISDVLATEKYQFLTALTGEKALQLVENEKIDLILLDLNMPDIGGYEICRRIKKISGAEHIPIIIVSSNSQEVDKVAALGLGAADYITKPFIPGEFRARVRTQLKMKNMHENLLKQRAIMSKLVVHDELTGLYNRRYLVSRLDEELARAGRYRSPLACMLLDIDDFKKINDTYGHATGDTVLRELSELLKGFVRETDVVARFGGEEFVLILPETDLPGAVSFAERLKERVGLFVFVQDKHNLHVTVSIGVSSNQNTEMNKEKLLEQADKYLYKAKDAGKNCVCAIITDT